MTLSIRDISTKERDGVTVLMLGLLQDLNDTTKGARLYTRLIEPRENGENARPRKALRAGHV